MRLLFLNSIIYSFRFIKLKMNGCIIGEATLSFSACLLINWGLIIKGNNSLFLEQINAVKSNPCGHMREQINAVLKVIPAGT